MIMMATETRQMTDVVNNTTMELQQDLAKSTPEQCVALTHSVPSVQMYYALRMKLERCGEAWLQSFLNLGGLESLLNSLDQLTGRGFTSFLDAILQLDCISCVRAVLNSNVGLDFMINSEGDIKKFAIALNTNNMLPKKHVFEILSALCAYSNNGYRQVLDALSYVKKEADLLHRFSIIVNELKVAESPQHQTSVLTLINCIINCTPEIMERIRIRNEFICLKLLDVLNFMRREEPDQNLIMQLEVFHERKIADEEAINIEHNVDLNSPQDLIDQIQNRVFGSSKMACLINILQDLLAVETVYPTNSEYLWQTLDCIVHHIVHTCDVARLDDLQSDLHKLPDQVYLGLKCVHSYRQLGDSGVSGCSANSNCCQNHSNLSQKKTSCQNQLNVGQTKSSVGQKQCSERQYLSNIFENYKEASTFVSCVHQNDLSKDKTVPRFSQSDHEKPQSELKPSQNISHSSQNETGNRQLAPVKAKSSQDMCNAVNIVSNIGKEKTIVCNQNNSSSHLSQCSTYDIVSINDPGLVGLQNTLKIRSGPKIVDYTLYDNIDYIDSGTDEGSELLAVGKHSNAVVMQPVPAPLCKMQDLKWVILSEDKIAGQYKCLWQTKAVNGHRLIPDFHRLEALFQVNTTDPPVEEVILLPSSTRLNINLFLNRLDNGAEDLVNSLEDGEAAHLTLPLLQYLTQILPSQEEVTMIQLYQGHRLKLGMAEQFILLLGDIPDYPILIEGHLTRAEFKSTISKFQASLVSMTEASKLIINSTELRNFLQLILSAGNFLNYGNFKGNCTGFKLSSLERLASVRSRSPYRTLLHHLVQLSEDQDKDALKFAKDISTLEKAAKCSVEELKTDISKLNCKLKHFVKKLSSSHSKIRLLFDSFVEAVKLELKSFHVSISEMMNLTDQLAQYFCEDPTTFNLQECFKYLLNFCKQIKRCQIDNATCVQQHQQAKERGDNFKRQVRNKVLILKFGKEAGASSSMMEENRMLEKILEHLHKGNFQPMARSEATTPDIDLHPLEVSSIACVGSPYAVRVSAETGLGKSTYPETPELEDVGDNPGKRIMKMVRSSTQKISSIIPRVDPLNPQSFKLKLPPNTTDTPKRPDVGKSTRGYLPLTVSKSVQSRLPLPTSEKKPGSLHSTKASTKGREENSKEEQKPVFAVPQKQLFPAKLEKDNQCADNNDKFSKTKRELFSSTQDYSPLRLHRTHSDLAEVLCVERKLSRYEENKNQNAAELGLAAPLAKPESCSSIHPLNLETRGRILQIDPSENVCQLQQGPVVKLPGPKIQKKSDKRSTVGGFFSKISRAVLKPKNSSSDDEVTIVTGMKTLPKSTEFTGHSKKSSIEDDKENIAAEDRVIKMTDEVQTERDHKHIKPESTSKMSHFFRGGVIRSSRFKGKKYVKLQQKNT
ncbi:hypothetical protein ACJMK2_032478 [Sinanodonta woodiana]|uniref:Inverted formin-2 n=1 Tax=Sinanodonta woodiana TaxID=1069815 RepID=A0ABD3X1W7_SINWO